MEQKDIKYGYVFKQTRAAFEQGAKVIIHQGGTGSGKTYDLMIFIIFFVCLRMKDKVVTVVSESRPHLDIGPVRILKDLLIKSGIYDDARYNDTKGRYIFHTGCVIEFFSADRIGKALGARRYMLYGNEINHIKFEIFDELARRSDTILADFNPSWQFWLENFQRYYAHNVLIKSNYAHNPFLPAVEKERIQLRASLDDNFRRVHIDCEYGGVEGIIFTNWDSVDTFPPECGKIAYGIDFGFSNDPTAIVMIGVKDGEVYIDEKVYETGLTNQDIIGKLAPYKIPHEMEIYADSAEPKSIEEIRRAGYHIKPVEKGQDSIRTGIDFMQTLRLHVTKNSVNTIKEFRNYSWQTNRDGGYVNVPINGFNHAIDAIRYAITMKLFKKPKTITHFG